MHEILETPREIYTETNAGSLNPFFIVGYARSGTTMLRLMLNHHPLLHVPRESWFLTDLMNQLPANRILKRSEVGKAFRIVTQHSRWGDLQLDASSLLNGVSRLEKPTLARFVDAIFSMSATAHGKTRWGDKTPAYLTEIERLSRVFPEGKFIHIVRDARDVCNSLTEVGWRGGSLRCIAPKWAHDVRTAISIGRKLPPHRYIETAYENLVLQPKRELDKLCKFLEVDYDERMKDFHKSASESIATWEKQIHRKTMRPPRSSDVHRWKRELTAFQIALVEAYAHDTMRKTGQVPNFNGTARLFPLSIRILAMAAGKTLRLRKTLKLPNSVVFRK